MRDIRLGTVARFPLAMNWTVLVVAWILASNLATMALPHSAPGHATGTYRLVATFTAGGFFGSLLAHELAHAFVARRNHIPVNRITLWLLGGMAELEREPTTPGTDFRVAVAGPATSLGLAAGLLLSLRALDTSDATHLWATALAWLATINIMLGVFNLLPGAPLDGGRILRAALWRLHDDRLRAARAATCAGTIVGLAVTGLGVAQYLRGAGVGGVWLAVVGWFIWSGARAEHTDLTTTAPNSGAKDSPRPDFGTSTTAPATELGTAAATATNAMPPSPHPAEHSAGTTQVWPPPAAPLHAVRR